jgi:glucose/arabinose dehydrogenase
MTRSRAGAFATASIGVLLGVAMSAASAATGGYATSGRCGAFPRVSLQTPPGTCVALVAGSADGLRFPRRILEVAPDRYWLIDMGSWEPRQGRLIEMTIAAGRVALRVLASKLDRPLGIAKGPDGRIYIGEAGRIWRTPIDGSVTQEVVIDGLPSDGAHPLKEFVFGADGHLFINVGSSTDACRDDAGVQAVPCPDLAGVRPRAAVYEAVLGGPANTLQSLRPYASGLRNSVALAFVPGANVLLQGENSIDYSDADNPPEELNQLVAGKHYGWPYCVGAGAAAHGYEKRFDCSGSAAPQMLWPAHAAPLQMLAVPQTARSPFAGQLLVAWHGYRPAGHRVVGYRLDAQGRAQGAPTVWIGGWNAAAGVRPLGAPTGITVDGSGRLWVVEDRNRSVLMLIRNER